MTTNQTIDGVMVLRAAVTLVRSNEAPVKDAAIRELRALLDAKPAEVTGDDVLRWMDEHAAAQAQGSPLGEIVEFGTGLKEVSWREGKMPALGTKLYAEQPAPVAADEMVEFSKWTHEVIAESRVGGVTIKIQRMQHLTQSEEKAAHDAWMARAALSTKSR